MEVQIGKLIQDARTYTADMQGKSVYEHFEKDLNAEAVVVLKNNYPVGIISRNDFYQKIGSAYGYSLYMNRPIKGLMNPHPLVVEARVDTSEVAVLAMSRELTNMYEPVVVVDDSGYAGMVSIKLFMYQFARQRENEIKLLTRHQNEIEEKNRQLQSRNSAIKNLLDNAGQGFLSFDSGLIINEEYSRECDRIFGFSISGLSYMDLLHKYIDSGFADNIGKVLERVFLVPEPAKALVYLSMLPEEQFINDRNIRFEYRLISDVSSCKVMVILTDITEKKQLEKQMEQERNNVKLVLQVLENKEDLKILMDDLQELIHVHLPPMIRQPETIRDALPDIYRTVHTYKGEFSQFFMLRTAAALHKMEENISAWLNSGPDFELPETLSYFQNLDAGRLMHEDLKIIRQVLGEEVFTGLQTVSVPKEALEELEKDLRNSSWPSGSAQRLVSKLRRLQCQNVKQILEQYDPYVQTLAEKLGKKIARMQITGKDIYLVKADYQTFWRSLIHLFRNIADHGIEKTKERLEAGKPEQGTIRILLESENEQNLRLLIQDDGRGIEIEKIRQRAVETGRIDEGQARMMRKEDLVNMVFSQGFSLQKKATLLSGRGVGLAAVKEEVERLNGTIRLESAAGEGTTFFIDLPAIRQY